MSTIRQVDPATLKPQASAPPDPLGPAPADAPAAPAKRISVPVIPSVKKAYAESQGGALIVTVPLLDGGEAKLKKPSVSLKMAVAQIMVGLGVQDDLVFRRTVHAILHVSNLSGEAIQRPVNHIELQKLLNRLGDDNIALIEVGYVSHFGVSVDTDLPLSDPQ